MRRVGQIGRSRKVSFIFLQTLCAFRTCLYILVYKIKIVTNILMGFKIWCQVGGGGIQFSKLPYVREFSNIWFQKLTDIRFKRSLGLGNVYWTFNLRAVFCLFETLKMFYPPEGLCASIVPKVVQLFFTSVLSPEGTLQSRYRRRSNCFYLCLILC